MESLGPGQALYHMTAMHREAGQAWADNSANTMPTSPAGGPPALSLRSQMRQLCLTLRHQQIRVSADREA